MLTTLVECAAGLIVGLSVALHIWQAVFGRGVSAKVMP